ncbi:hypothetical protein LARV_02557 [Longilinea arvoryzae]|uniref:Uncharacterized protein n=1 Tax=Longilinea arvoryzae TaxID=360412 RepID=A0A0S7BGP8_9CHLR|nr:hypothetical protein [Longilinea arvoryzae]GAP14781.1 hypothetical protein LARV_02557 [Longilinea arvoryzae]
MAEENALPIEFNEIEDEYIEQRIQPTANMDVETIEILLDDRIATGG